MGTDVAPKEAPLFLSLSPRPLSFDLNSDEFGIRVRVRVGFEGRGGGRETRRVRPPERTDRASSSGMGFGGD